MPLAVVELKGATTDLDRDRSNGRTAVQQCWDYLNALPGCPWGIVSNFRTIRLYHREKGNAGLRGIHAPGTAEPRAIQRVLLHVRARRAAAIADRPEQPRAPANCCTRRPIARKGSATNLYKAYQWRRLELIEHLNRKEGKSLDEAIRIAQKLLDRIIFIAFCEDRELLPRKLAGGHARPTIRMYSRAKNPAWENFLDLFTAIDKGAKGKREIPPSTAGCSPTTRRSTTLNWPSEKWTNAFAGFGNYDFSEEVNVEVLGHLFERSITELEKLRVGGLFALKAGTEAQNGQRHEPASRARRKKREGQAGRRRVAALQNAQERQRKRFGIYYTPARVHRPDRRAHRRRAGRGALRRIARAAPGRSRGPQGPGLREAAGLLDRRAWKTSRQLTVCDPACGSGAFLIRAYEALDAHYKAVVHGLAGAGMPAAEVAKLEDAIPDLILSHNLYGVDLSRAGGRDHATRPLDPLGPQGPHAGRSVAEHRLGQQPGHRCRAVDPEARSIGRDGFPPIFGDGGPGGFSCVIGNPPWERVKVQDREFFSLTDPATAGAVSANDRKKRIAAMPTANPELHASYLAARDHAQRMLDYARGSGRYPLTGKGDVNLYMLFAELARTLVAPDGLVGLLVPSGIATDDTTKEFFSDLMEAKRLVSLYDFENKAAISRTCIGRFKFTALVFGGEAARRRAGRLRFLCPRRRRHRREQNKQRHIPLTAADMALLEPQHQDLPDLPHAARRRLDQGHLQAHPHPDRREPQDKAATRGESSSSRCSTRPTTPSIFTRPRSGRRRATSCEGNVYRKAKKRALPLYEAKMVQAFDHRAASVTVDEENWVRQGQKAETSLVQHQNPEFCVHAPVVGG